MKSLIKIHDKIELIKSCKKQLRNKKFVLNAPESIVNIKKQTLNDCKNYLSHSKKEVSNYYNLLRGVIKDSIYVEKIIFSIEQDRDNIKNDFELYSPEWFKWYYTIPTLKEMLIKVDEKQFQRDLKMLNVTNDSNIKSRFNLKQ
jgi:hypothetical protein